MYIIGNGRLITFDNGTFFENGAVVTDGDHILAVGDYHELKKLYSEAELIDAKGGCILPGLINTHDHIYSAFARGLSIRGYSPKNFNDILEGLWWTLDRKLTHENNRLSAEATCIDCIKNGVTTIFDHHASYGAIEGSLDDIADATTRYGIRACLCYEVSDRDGEEKMRAAVLENERFILRAQKDTEDRLKGLMGLHASFTLSDRTLGFVNEHRHGEGCHIHVAEGISDVEQCLKAHGKRIIHRLYDNGILGDRTLAVHCVHISPGEMDLIRDTGTAIVHNPESNMGNAVGCGPVMEMVHRGLLVGLGTDGYTNDMLESSKVAHILHKHHLGDPNAAWNEVPAMLFENNRAIAARYFSGPLGILRPGAHADVIVTDYDPLTPMTPANVAGHIVFGMNGRSVVTTICAGRVLMKDRELIGVDEAAVMAACRESATALARSINA